MSQKLDNSPAVIGIDIGKDSFHIVGQNRRGAIVLRQKWSASCRAAARITVRSVSAMPLKAPQERTSQKAGVGPRADMP
jgi:hypothetical protein